MRLKQIPPKVSYCLLVPIAVLSLAGTASAGLISSVSYFPDAGTSETNTGASGTTLPFVKQLSVTSQDGYVNAAFNYADDGSQAIFSTNCNGSVQGFESVGIQSNVYFTLSQPATYAATITMSAGADLSQEAIMLLNSGDTGNFVLNLGTASDGSVAENGTLQAGPYIYQDTWNMSGEALLPFEAGDYSDALVLTPIPEPSSFFVAAFCGIALIMRPRSVRSIPRKLENSDGAKRI